MAASDIITAVAPQPSFTGPYSPLQYDHNFEGRFSYLGEIYKKQREGKGHLGSFFSTPSPSNSQNRCNGNWANRQTQDKIHMSHEPVGKIPSTSSSPTNKPISTSRELPPIHSHELIGIHRDVPQRPQSGHEMPMRPTPPPSSTPPEQRTARPIGVENLLNPSASGNFGSGSQRQHAERTDSPRALPAAGMSRPTSPSLPSLSARNSSSGEISLPSITPPLMHAFPPQPRAMTPRSPTGYGPGPMTSGLPTGNIDARQSPFVFPRDQATASMGHDLLPSTIVGTTQNSITSAYAPSSPRARQLSQMGQIPRPQNVTSGQGGMGPSRFIASRSSSPSSISQRPLTPANGTQPGQPQSFFASSFPPTGPASSMPPGSFDKKPISGPGPTMPGQYPMMTLETESGPIQVPVDVQAASKVADEKRKRNATASHRFRQRRKEKEQETANSIATLESRVREMSDEKEYYQRERDFLQDVIMRNRIPIPPRPASPRRRRHASLGGPNISQFQDPEAASREEGRNTRRRTSAYVPPQGPHPHTVEPPPPMPPYGRISALPTEEIQNSQQRLRPQGSFHPGGNPYGSNAPH